MKEKPGPTLIQKLALFYLIGLALIGKFPGRKTPYDRG